MSGVELHDEVALRLARLEQRYTTGRRTIVEVLETADRPLTVPEMIEKAPAATMPVSSAYRNLAVLLEAGVVHRVSGTDEHTRFELAEELAGHHHHLLCASCGSVADVSALPRLERALADSIRIIREKTGFEVTSHRIDLLGRCEACRP